MLLDHLSCGRGLINVWIVVVDGDSPHDVPGRRRPTGMEQRVQTHDNNSIPLPWSEYFAGASFQQVIGFDNIVYTECCCLHYQEVVDTAVGDE
jgi:hypothetical protein